MSTGNVNFPNRFVPFTPSDVSPERQLKRLLISQDSQKVFEDTRRQLTEGVRRTQRDQASGPVFQDLSDRLSAIAGDLVSKHSLTSSVPLNLGAGNGNLVTGIDPSAPLNTQSFAQPVTAGTITATFQVNGGGAVTRTVSVDPTRSLNTTLQTLSGLTAGAVTPLAASFQGGQVGFQVTSTGGNSFAFSLADGTSNLVSALTDGGRASVQAYTGQTTVGTAPGTAFASLNVTFNGISTTIGSPTTTSAGLSPYQRATQLAAQINDGLATSGAAQQGLTATALSNGTLELTASNAPAGNGLGLSVSESGPGQTLGFASGFNTVATLATTPKLSGPDATLGQLAGQLGLQAVNGAFQGTVNGVAFRFGQDESLSSALQDISASAAGVSATYDATTQQVTLSQTTPGVAPIDVRDTSGNLFSALKLATVNDADPGAAAGAVLDSLHAAASKLNDALNLIDTALGPTGGLKNVQLLHDLQDALNAQFKPSAGGHTLADLGFTREDGQLKVDAARQQDLLKTDPAELLAAATAIANQGVAPLVSNSQQAVSDELSRAPLEQRLARQNVHARAELARLQDRQGVLLTQETALDKVKETIKTQQDSLQEEQHRLAVNGGNYVPPRHEDLLKPLGQPDQSLPPEPLRDRLGLQPPEPAPTPLTPTSTSPAPSNGLLSFGMGNSGS